jgi:aspartyl-tRNA(Asn)/glutamyl-tRNA(Gln) amidotransferase subunit B
MIHGSRPKFIFDDEPWSHIHNVMCMLIHEYQDWVDDLKEKCKESQQYPGPFLLAAINFVTNDMAAYCNANGLTNIFDYPLSKDRIVDIVTLMSLRKECGIGAEVVTAVVKKLLKDDKLSYADALESSLPIVMDDDELRTIVTEVISEHPDKVVEWKGGKKGIASMFIGSVMRKKKGLEPKKVAATIEEILKTL